MELSIPPRTIIVPLDFTKDSDRALAYARAMAGPETRVVGLHVQTPIPPTPSMMPAATSATAASWHELLEIRAEQDRVQLQKRSASGLELDIITSGEHPAGAIAGAVASLSADLVVMGSHGRTGLKRLLLGSVAERTVRLSPSHVLVVRGEGEEAPWPPRTLLCPVDFSVLSQQALVGAAALASAVSARLIALHVLTPGTLPPSVATGLPPEGGGWADLFTAGVPGATRRLEQELVAAGADSKAEALVVDGRPGEAIEGAASSEDVDLIVISSHGRTGLERALLGSVAERTVRLAQRPVLVLR